MLIHFIMHIHIDITPMFPSKPQLHSKKYHHIYNGVAHLPVRSWVRGPIIDTTDCDDCASVYIYEIEICFARNRSCTLYRDWEDFERLRKTITPWRDAVRYKDRDDVSGLHQFIREALAKRPRDCALEYFLRRRIDDCDGLC
ncbi:hypothetical protein F5B20DRAFT_543463 [Whalleya microplaca]|nr:hypothetical protein F5B20DRAFT_543463 [Whalleya microplaca]